MFGLRKRQQTIGKKKHLKNGFLSPTMLDAVNQRPREERYDCQSVTEKAASSSLSFL